MQILILLYSKYLHNYLMQERSSLIMPQHICCSEENIAVSVCINEKCQQCAFICSKPSCDCMKKLHFKCNSNNLEFILKSIEKQKISTTSEDESAFKAIQKLYDDMIERLSNDRQNFMDSIEMFGVKPACIKMVTLINEDRSKQINGKLMRNVRNEIDLTREQQLQEEKNLLVQHINQFWKKKQGKFIQICNELSYFTQNLSNWKFNSFNSDIVPGLKEQKILLSFFETPVIKIELIFRASENDFKANAFHKNCDNVANTLTILETQSGNIIGGYTPAKWRSTANWTYEKDDTDTSFLFSVTLNEKYPLKDKTKAIYNCQSSGPDFGNNDLYIFDNANNNSCTYFPAAYNNGKYKNDNTSRVAFVGEKINGHNFKVKDYQVYKLTFP